MFLDCTIRDLFREFVVGKRAALTRLERDVVMAWNTAALTGSAWAGKLPKLETLLRKIQPVPTKSEVRATFYQIAAVCGKSVGKTRLIKRDG